LDGGYFGMAYIDLMINQHPEVRIVGESAPYVPRIFGFRVWKRPEVVEEEDG
jgi:hypothetical protein